MLGQAHTWEWYPDANKELLSLAYDNLPESSKFLRLMVMTSAHCWATEDEGNCRLILQTLRDWNQDFTFEVTVALAELLQQYRKQGQAYSTQYPGVHTYNSCVFHDHLELDEASCRERINNKAHVFDELIEARAKDAKSIVSKEQDTSSGPSGTSAMIQDGSLTPTCAPGTTPETHVTGLTYAPRVDSRSKKYTQDAHLDLPTRRFLDSSIFGLSLAFGEQTRSLNVL
ncbi:hypothetical protein EK21DRAFT_117332 [Setomelanomma holmii]|uniref:Uncharacterized protein n=1 Tax=Setomelanomma holmii TaxID=210430 RepID=A0A9P4LH17_9PLEO|nr:hypothetical protein EK21DRAFT_117332 [Setomelanomma holmii]